jgi:AcrR family transcriptional regulator
MTSKPLKPRFRRTTPAVRREALIEATLLCLKKYGHEGASIRRISAAAGVSIGLINHHFPSKAGLIAAAYERFALDLQASMRAVADQQVFPRERLRRFFQASFSPEILDPAVFNVWLVFWSMVKHSPEMRAVHKRTYRRYRSMLEGFLGEVAAAGAVPRFDLRLAAVALSALLDGLWIELSLSPATFKPADAMALCDDWVGALCGGALPRLLQASR